MFLSPRMIQIITVSRSEFPKFHFAISYLKKSSPVGRTSPPSLPLGWVCDRSAPVRDIPLFFRSLWDPARLGDPHPLRGDLLIPIGDLLTKLSTSPRASSLHCVPLLLTSRWPPSHFSSSPELARADEFGLFCRYSRPPLDSYLGSFAVPRDRVAFNLLCLKQGRRKQFGRPGKEKKENAALSPR